MALRLLSSPRSHTQRAATFPRDRDARPFHITGQPRKLLRFLEGQNGSKKQKENRTGEQIHTHKTPTEVLEINVLFCLIFVESTTDGNYNSMPKFSSYKQQNLIFLSHFPYRFRDCYLASDDTKDASSARIRQREYSLLLNDAKQQRN